MTDTTATTSSAHTCSSSSSHSSNPSRSSDNCTQGNVCENAGQDGISGSDKYRYAGTSGVKVLQDPKRARSSNSGSASVKGESGSENTVLRMVDLNYGGNSGALSTFDHDVADSRSSHTVTRGNDPPYTCSSSLVERVTQCCVVLLAFTTVLPTITATPDTERLPLSLLV